MNKYSTSIKNSASIIQSTISTPLDYAVILGSGLNNVADNLLDKASKAFHFSYTDLPCLTPPSIPSHSGTLSIIELHGKQIALCQGRIHLYEGYSPHEVCAMIYLLNELGCQNLIITNAAGSLNEHFQPGNPMLISDHINFTGHNPIIGQAPSFGNQFADMSQAYNKDWRTHCIHAVPHSEFGIYAGVLGPSLETNAERRMYRALGADAVGMSTVTEVIAANQCGMDVLGISAITNLALGDENQMPDTIEDVLEHAAIASKKMSQLIDAALQWSA